MAEQTSQKRPNHPLQEIYKDEKGTLRFRKNAIVEFLLDNGPHDMNSLRRLDFSNEDRAQFAMLIGYSLPGFSELSYVSEETFTAACTVAEDNSTKELLARIEFLRGVIENLRSALRLPVSKLYGISESDLQGGVPIV